MSSSLAIRHGVVWICRSAGGARLVPYDLGGRRIGAGFEIRGAAGPRGGAADVRGIAVDEDRRIWVAEGGAGGVRSFTAFGAGSTGIPDPDGQLDDAAGIAADGVETELRLLLSRRGERRHGLRLLDPRTGSVRSFRPEGDPSGAFGNLAGVALAGRLAFACEAGRGLVQVFRDGDYHYRIAFESDGGPRVRGEPRVVAAARDGRSIVAGRIGETGAVLLFDAGGRLVRRLDGELDSTEAVGDDVSGVVLHEGASERDSVVLVLERAGSRVLAFTLEGGCLGSFHDLEVHTFRSDEAPDAGLGIRPRSQRLT